MSTMFRSLRLTRSDPNFSKQTVLKNNAEKNTDTMAAYADVHPVP
jgi:hypothetical protein